MARPKGSVNKKKTTIKPQIIEPEKHIKSNIKQTKNTIEIKNPCTCCGDNKTLGFNTSFNPMLKELGRLWICKKCLEDEYQKYLAKYEDGRLALYYLCRKFDIFFASSAYEGAVNNSAKLGWSIVASYFKQINSFRDENYMAKNGYGVCFDESFEFLDRVNLPVSEVKSEEIDIKEDKSNEKKNKKKLSKEDIQNEKDVIRLLGYDPFENEHTDDRKFLFNKLVDFLDSDTLLDNFKLPIVIEIVKSFGQIEKINQALANIAVENIASSVADVKNLMMTKSSTLGSILAMAKDNGISVNYSNNKSKGAGTLTGIIKELQEKGVHSAAVNLYDIETCDGMKQVADISNRSILDQLNLNEGDYVDMLKMQRELIQTLDDKSKKFEEENRVLKVKMSQIEKHLKENKNKA